ncbi:MAG: hypothetical protein PHX27_02320 [Candidatus ainarchaeum sp.]|nr:hypothetical protein [Candidatus ainarchaeum sp.]
MIVVILLSIIALLLLFLVFLYNINLPKNIIIVKEQELLLLVDQLKIVEKKFFQGKIKKNVFDNLKGDIEINFVLKELEIFRLKKIDFSKLNEKLDQLSVKLKNPTRFKKTKLKNLIRESELILAELDIIEKKFLKKEISASSFEKLVHIKENEMIAKESQIVNYIKK